MIHIEPIPAFQDNYIWCLYDDQSQLAYIVDPGDAAPVIDTLRAKNLQLAGLLITHHHYDHTGGIGALLSIEQVPVYGPNNPDIPQINTPLAAGDRCTVLGWHFTVLTIPGHTLDHIAFYSADPPNAPLLFCGDTLFAGGCGRLFEGSAKQMYHSLQQLAALPDATRIYCAHEYTLANLRFATAVEPNNPQLQQRIQQESDKRRQHLPTIPSTLALEKATNVFLRCDQPTVMQSATKRKGSPCRDTVEVFATIRDWKDHF